MAGTPGARRSRAGRKYAPARRRCLCLDDSHMKLLRAWGRGNASAGLRWLIDTAAPLIVRRRDVYSIPPA